MDVRPTSATQIVVIAPAVFFAYTESEGKHPIKMIFLGMLED